MKTWIRDFIHNETAGGLCLIAVTALALVFANSAYAGLYHDFLHASVKLGFTMHDVFFGLDKTIFQWVNDALMAFFFLLIGLEIKRECINGELSTRDRALQPLFAAIGGMILPILVFLGVNHNDPETIKGWAVPCATDIAFALGVLALLGSRVPPAIKILLTAIAIIDDLLAILIIALFYTGDLHALYLLYAAAGIAVLWLLNYFNVARISLYILVGAFVWYGFLKTGIHPTLAGVVTALAVPLQTKNNQQHTSPLMKLEHGLHFWVVFLIVPLFAFANAGLNFSGIGIQDYTHPLTLGIMGGLVLGKPVGIMAGLALAHMTGIAKKPLRMSWGDYAGMAILCGIGFTVSLFIGELGFPAHDVLDQVRLGVLSASIFMALAGWLVCRFTFVTPIRRATN